jgi:CheY-like chemotaxis protein
METKVYVQKDSEPLHVLLIGNNPIDMSKILEKLQHLRGKKIITEIAFDLKSIVGRLMKFRPHYILIDDNIGRNELTETVRTLTSQNKTKNIPITVLKNSNYHESYGAGAGGVLDYILKTNFSADALYNTLRNSLKLRRTQTLLYKAYAKRRKAFKKAMFQI